MASKIWTSTVVFFGISEWIRIRLRSRQCASHWSTSFQACYPQILPLKNIQRWLATIYKYKILRTSMSASAPPNTSSTSFLTIICLDVSFSCTERESTLFGICGIGTTWKMQERLPNLVDVWASPPNRQGIFDRNQACAESGNKAAGMSDIWRQRLTRAQFRQSTNWHLKTNIKKSFSSWSLCRPMWYWLTAMAQVGQNWQAIAILTAWVWVKRHFSLWEARSF